MWLVMRAPFLRDRLFGDLYQDFLAFLQQVADRRHAPRRLMTLRASAHATSGRAATASATTVLRPAFRALLVACGCRRTLFRAGPFQIFRRGFLYLAVFSLFFRQTKSLLYFLQLFRLQSLGFILSGSAFVHMRITHRFHQLAAHGDQLVAGLAQYLFFQLFKFGNSRSSWKPGISLSSSSISSSSITPCA